MPAHENSPPEEAALRDILESRPAEARQLLPLLMAVQTRFRHLPEAALRAIAARLGLPLVRVFAMAGFYRALSLEPKGERVVKVCCGTACHLRGSPAIIEALEKELDLKLGRTRADGAYTLEAVNCLGACALAPVVMIDEETFGGQSPAGVPELFKKATTPGASEARKG